MHTLSKLDSLLSMLRVARGTQTFAARSHEIPARTAFTKGNTLRGLCASLRVQVAHLPRLRCGPGTGHCKGIRHCGERVLSFSLGALVGVKPEVEKEWPK